MINAGSGSAGDQRRHYRQRRRGRTAYASSVTGSLAHLMALGIGEHASAIPIAVARGMSMNRDGFPGAVHAIRASGDSREHAGRVARSRTFDIADHGGGGAVPGSAGTVITSGARG